MLSYFKTHDYRRTSSHINEYMLKEVTFRHKETGRMIFTRVFEPIKKSVEEMVYEIIQKEFYWESWRASLHGSVIRDVVTYLTKSKDNPELPVVVVVNSWMAFQDGMFCYEKLIFAEWDEVHEVFADYFREGKCAYKFFPNHKFGPTYFRNHLDDTPYVGTNREVVDPDNYWHRPLDFITEPFQMEDPQGRPTKIIDDLQLPLFFKILRDQGMSEVTIYLLAACLGRCLFRAGEKDSWQFWPCLIGVGGSGKSTVCSIFEEMFNPRDRAALSSDMEQVFGRDRLPDKRIIIVPDMGLKSCGLSMDFFKSAVSNDGMSLPVKYGREVRSVEKFDVPGLICTNELPKEWLADQKNAVLRRLMFFYFPTMASPRNPNLKKLILDDEFTHFLLFIVLAYYELPKDMDVSQSYPITEDMKKTNVRMQRISNALLDFLLNDDYVILDEEERCSMRGMVASYGVFVRNVRGDKPCQFNQDYYEMPFGLLGLRVVNLDGSEFVQGCRLVNEDS